MPGNSTTFDLTKFIKVCGMMTSTHDGEALSAVRRANAMLKDAGMTWEQALTRAAGNSHSPPPPGPASTAQGRYHRRTSTPDEKWDNFTINEPQVAEWIWDNKDRNQFAASLYRGVCKFGSLTERQMEAVERNL